MNGEMYDLCSLTLHAEKALRGNTVFEPVEMKYVAQRKFVFSQSFGSTFSQEEWFRISVKRGLKAVRMLAPTAVKDRGILGFVNTTQAYLALFREDGSVAALLPKWEFQKTETMWHVTYQEQEWPDSPKGIPVFQNETETLRSVLQEIEELARRIGEPYFAQCFQDAQDLLDGNGTMPSDMFADVPEPYRSILGAVSKGDVFGAMGSWNDSPPYEAQQKGLKDEYDRLSDALLKYNRLNMLYAVNTCYSEME